MAQQTLDFVIAQQVTGQAEVAKLINSVGALDAEMKKLRAATAGMSGGFNQAAQAIRGNTNVLDAQSKALRNNRQGMQQAGMQINDFVTSISTGASPVQAFNQQIGQLGFAMSMMEGRVGAVGRFLAGPWSIAVIGATMILGPMIERFITGGSAAENAADKISQIALASDKTSSAQSILGNVMDVTTGKMRTQSAAAINLARAQLEVERVNARIRAQQARTTLERAAERSVEVGRTRVFTGDRTGGFDIPIRRQTVSAAEAARALRGEVGAALDNLRALNDAGKITDQRFAEIAAAAANLGVENENMKMFGEALESLGKQTPFTAAGVAATSSAARDLSGATGQVLSPMEQFLASLAKTDDRLELARQAFADGTISVRQFREEVERANKAQNNFAKIPDNMIKILQGAGKPISFPEIPQEISVPPALQEILDKNAEIAKSFDAIGNSVANGFKGMITGAQSFGDAMKGIINAVIEELFRLFVVQQIVGMVSKGMSMLTGIPIDARAMGGSVGQNKPYLVGERGPEIFVPGKSGTVIPTQNSHVAGSGGSVINVSVDARGATSPEMVRQQVQQGILEAAPSIVAAAEQRTISTLRRPRLAGAL